MLSGSLSHSLASHAVWLALSLPRFAAVCLALTLPRFGRSLPHSLSSEVSRCEGREVQREMSRYLE